MALTGDDLDRYNNIGGGQPRSPKLGDLLNAGLIGNPTYAGVTGTLDFYVETTGSDTENDGTSVANAFRQPQAVINQLDLSKLNTGLRIRVNCGAGTFEMPDLSNIPAGVLFEVRGNRTNPLYSGAAPSFSNIAGRVVTQEANIGVYDGVAADGDAWILFDYEGAFDIPSLAAPCKASVSPNLNIVAPGGVAFGTTSVYPFETVFTVPTRINNTFKGKFQDQNEFRGCTFYGISFSLLPSGGFTVTHQSTWEGIAFNGCRWVASAGNSSRIGFKRCFVSGYTGPNVLATFLDADAFQTEDGNQLYALISAAEMVVEGALEISALNLTGGNLGVRLGSERVAVVPSVYITTGGIDFDHNGDACFSAFSGTIVQAANVTVNGTVVHYVTNRPDFPGLRSYNVSGSRTVTGTTTGNCIELVNGAQATGVEAACSGNLASSGGSEIVVGGNAGATFASLPADDGGAAAPQFCRAT